MSKDRGGQGELPLLECGTAFRVRLIKQAGLLVAVLPGTFYSI